MSDVWVAVVTSHSTGFFFPSFGHSWISIHLNSSIGLIDIFYLKKKIVASNRTRERGVRSEAGSESVVLMYVDSFHAVVVYIIK